MSLYNGKWSTAINPLVHVYFFNPVTGIITYEAMRSPGAPPSSSPRLQHIPGQPKPRSLGKDTRGLIEDLVIRHDHAVYFIATPPSKWEPLTDKDRAAKIRRAKIHVRKMELDALDLDAALTQDDPNDDDDEPEDVRCVQPISVFKLHLTVTYTSSSGDLESSSCYSYDSSAMSIGDCSGESSILSIEQSQCSRDSFSTDNSLSADDADRDEDEASEHQDDQSQENARGNVATVTAPLLPSHLSVTTSGSLVAHTSSATADLHIFPTTPPESPFRPPSRYLLSIPKTPSSLRKLTYPVPVEPIQGEQRSNKRKADDSEDSRTVKKLKTAHSTDTPAEPQAAPATDPPQAQQQTTSLKRKREDDEDTDDTAAASGSSQQDDPDSGPAAKKPKMAPEPEPTSIPRRRRRRPKVVRPLARKMWDGLMRTKLVALKLGATFSDFGFLPARKKTRRAA